MSDVQTLTAPPLVAFPARPAAPRLSRARLVAAGAVPLVLAGALAWQWSSVRSGAAAVAHADRWWLLAALVTVGLTTLASSCVQLGATSAPLPFGRVVATQVAGSFVNHILPAGLGAAALNVRMLRRSGLSRSGVAGAVGLTTVANVVVHTLALIVLLFTAAGAGLQLPRGPVLLASGGSLAALILAAVLAARLGHRSRRWGASIDRVLIDARAALARPGRASLLWGGAAAVPALHVLTLYTVLRALDLPAPLGPVAVAYLGASAVAALIPSPGGFGALDVTLLAALATTGVGASSAAAAVIGYRLLTVWLPLLPGAAVLSMLLRRRVV